MTTNNEAGLESSLGVVNYLLSLTIYELIHSVVWLLVSFGVATVMLGFLPLDSHGIGVVVVVSFLVVGVLAPDKLNFGQGRGSWTLGKQELKNMEAGLGRKELIMVRAVMSFFLLAMIYVGVRLVVERFAGVFLRSAMITSLFPIYCPMGAGTGTCVNSYSGGELGRRVISETALVITNLHLGEAGYWLGRRVRNIVGW